jgi:hypothetical protein
VEQKQQRFAFFEVRTIYEFKADKVVVDPIVLSILSEIFKSLASSESAGVYEIVVQRALPTFSTAIGSAALSESWVAGSAIDLVTSLVQGSPKDRLGAGFFGVLAPPLFKCLAEAEDRDVLSVRQVS